MNKKTCSNRKKKNKNTKKIYLNKNFKIKNQYNCFKKALNRGSNCGNCSSFSTDSCPNPSIASAGLLCFSWTND